MSGFSLYQISSDYLSALDALTADDDIPPEAIADTLEGLAGAWEDKAMNVARFIKNLEAEAFAIKEAMKNMDARMKASQAKASRLADYLKDELERTGLKPKAADIAIRTQKNPASVVIDREEFIPNEFRQEVTTWRVDKRAIKDAWTAGTSVPGTRLEQSTRLVIS
jgi:hypothetical protein